MIVAFFDKIDFWGTLKHIDRFVVMCYSSVGVLTIWSVISFHMSSQADLHN